MDWYTSPVHRDFPWVLGMFRRSDILMARISVEGLLALSARTP